MDSWTELEDVSDGYYVRGLTGGTIAINGVFAQLWNPSTTRRIEVFEVFWGCVGDTGTSIIQPRLCRSTARGATPNNTVTPDADNAGQADAIPPSGAVLEMGLFGTDPTESPLPALWGLGCFTMVATSTAPAARLPLARVIVVPPGTGLILKATSTESFTGPFDVTFGFED